MAAPHEIGPAERDSQEIELRRIVNLTPQMLAVMEPDGRISWVNDPVLEYLGISLADLNADDLRARIFHPEDVETSEDRNQAIARGMPFEVEQRLRHKEGKYRWFLIRYKPLKDAEGRVLRWYGGATDIEDRKQAEQALRRSEAYLAEAQRLNHTGSWALRPPASKAHYWSDEMFRIWGFDPQHGIPDWQSSMERVHPDDRDVIRQAVEQVLEGHVTVDGEGEHRLVLPDGTVKYVHALAHPVFDHAGHVIEYVGSTVDVTERKRSEQERERLRQLEADLARLNRVSMMGELAASLAHEIKQPIAAVATNAKTGLRWLQREPPDAGEAREALSRIVNDAKRADDIIERNRSLYQRDTPKGETVNLNEVVREIIVLLQDGANRQSVSIRAELDGDVPTMSADRVQIQQVLMNLMLNGIEAMKDTGGELTIRSKRTEGRQVLLSVSDVGCGLPSENTDRVFDAFFTTKAQGTGMGLCICRRIIESHGGRLWACANTGRGATFHFTLPSAPSASSTTAA